MLISGKKKNTVNTQNTQLFFTEINFRCKAVSLLPITTVSDCYLIIWFFIVFRPSFPPLVKVVTVSTCLVEMPVLVTTV